MQKYVKSLGDAGSAKNSAKILSPNEDHMNQTGKLPLISEFAAKNFETIRMQPLPNL